MAKTRFEWDLDKDATNQEKHGVSFALAQYAFADPRRVIAKDITIAGRRTASTASEKSRVAF